MKTQNELMALITEKVEEIQRKQALHDDRTMLVKIFSEEVRDLTQELTDSEHELSVLFEELRETILEKSSS